MKFPKKIEQYFDNLENFQKTCDDNVSSFIGIFQPLLYKENNASLYIEVGKKEENGFFSLLSVTVKNFYVMLSCCDNDVCFVIKNNEVYGRETTTILNLSMISNIIINRSEDNQMSGYTYKIYFSYGDIDYYMKIMDNK